MRSEEKESRATGTDMRFLGMRAQRSIWEHHMKLGGCSGSPMHGCGVGGQALTRHTRTHLGPVEVKRLEGNLKIETVERGKHHRNRTNSTK